eukprot:jgi/Hompol1/3018/HPOL_003091-RA
MIIDRIAHIADKLPTPMCCSCDAVGSLDRLHACLHCVFIGCWKQKHIHAHLSDRNHTFGNADCAALTIDPDFCLHVALSIVNPSMDFIHCTVYCTKCKDYIYDLDLERILNAERARIDFAASRIKGI